MDAAPAAAFFHRNGDDLASRHGVPEPAPEDHFYGERSGTLRDPFGHRRLIGHAIEEVSPEEMQRRCTALFAAPG